jgi:hypothetical protein
VIRLKIDPKFPQRSGSRNKINKKFSIYILAEKDEKNNKNSIIAEDVSREVGAQV